MDKLSICNSALIKCGAEVIESVTQSNKRAKLVNQQYSVIKRKLLRSHPWRFALKQAELVQDTSYVRILDFDNAFDLPSDYLKLMQLTEYPQHDIDYAIEGDKLLTNEGEAPIRYIADVDENLFTADFSELLAWFLADDISYALVQSESVKNQITQNKLQAQRDIRSISAQERSPQELTDDSFIQVRL